MVFASDAIINIRNIVRQIDLLLLISVLFHRELPMINTLLILCIQVKL